MEHLDGLIQTLCVLQPGKHKSQKFPVTFVSHVLTNDSTNGLEHMRRAKVEHSIFLDGLQLPFALADSEASPQIG